MLPNGVSNAPWSLCLAALIEGPVADDASDSVSALPNPLGGDGLASGMVMIRQLKNGVLLYL